MNLLVSNSAQCVRFTIAVPWKSMSKPHYGSDPTMFLQAVDTRPGRGQLDDSSRNFVDKIKVVGIIDAAVKLSAAQVAGCLGTESTRLCSQKEPSTRFRNANADSLYHGIRAKDARGGVAATIHNSRLSPKDSLSYHIISSTSRSCRQADWQGDSQVRFQIGQPQCPRTNPIL